MSDQWWLRTQDEVFGPVTRDNLLEWARMGRIQPGQDVSSDGLSWMPATEVAFLDMRWSIDIGDGTPRGPFNKQAAQALLASGRLPRGSMLVEVVPPAEEAPKASAMTPQCKVAPEETASEVSPSDAATAAVVSRVENRADEAERNELLRHVETLQAGLRAAEARADEAERQTAEARREAKAAVKAADAAEARLAAAQADAARKDTDLAAARAAADQTRTEAQAARAAAQANEEAYEDRIKALSDEIRRLPPTAQLAADAQAAMYALMKDEADELAAALEAENREAEALRQYRRQRIERLLGRRQEILRRIGTDAEDMTRRALKTYPEDPRTAHMRQELDALRVLQERSAQEAERKIRDLSAKLRDREGEAIRLRQQVQDVAVVYRQLQDTREKLMTREKELVEERQKAEAERRQQAAAQQTLLARLSALEMGMPGTTNQSREARTVRLAPWMGLKQ